MEVENRKKKKKKNEILLPSSLCFLNIAKPTVTRGLLAIIWREVKPYYSPRKPRRMDWGCIQARLLKHKQVGRRLRRVKYQKCVQKKRGGARPETQSANLRRASLPGFMHKGQRQPLPSGKREAQRAAE